MSLMHFNNAVIFWYKPALKKLKRMEDSAKEDAGESPLCLVSRCISNSESLVGANINQYQPVTRCLSGIGFVRDGPILKGYTLAVQQRMKTISCNCDMSSTN